MIENWREKIPSLRGKKARYAFMALAVLGLWLIGYSLGLVVQKRMQNFLSNHGIGEAVVTDFNTTRGGEIMFSDIKLDHDGFSRIGNIRARLRWPFLFSSRAFSEVIIDRLALTGEISEDGLLSVAGLKASALSPLVETNSLILNSGQIDLNTPAGAIRLMAKGRMTRQDNGDQKIEAALWGSQYQLVMDTRSNMLVNIAGKWKDATEIREARINLPHFSLARLSGWVSANGTPGVSPTVSGQLSAGQMRLGDNAAFNNIDMTFSGPMDLCHITLHGLVSNYPSMAITADLTRNDKDLQIHATIEAVNINDLLSFLQNLRSDLALTMPRSSILTTLLITPGNLNRIRNEVSKLKYDSLELVLDGVPDGLTGQIFLHNKNSNPDEKTIISMNPD